MNREWEKGLKRGFRSIFERGIYEYHIKINIIIDILYNKVCLHYTSVSKGQDIDDNLKYCFSEMILLKYINIFKVLI